MSLPSLLPTSAYPRETSQSQPQKPEARGFRHGCSAIGARDDVIELMIWIILGPAYLGNIAKAGKSKRFSSERHPIQRERLNHRPASGEVTGKGHANCTEIIGFGEVDAGQGERSTTGQRQLGQAISSAVKQRSGAAKFRVERAHCEKII